MWYECLENTKLLREVYNDIPKLKKVNINSIVFHLSSKKIAVSFEMPHYCDNPSESWGNYETPKGSKPIICVALSFSDVNVFYLKNTHDSYLNGNIDISVNDIDINSSRISFMIMENITK